MIALPVRRWIIVGLLIALFSMPLVSALFTLLRIPLTAQNVLFREAILFTCGPFCCLLSEERSAWVGTPSVYSGRDWATLRFG